MIFKFINKIKNVLLFLNFIFIPNIILAQSIRGTTSGVASLDGKQAAVKSVNEMAKLIYTFAYVIFVMTVFVGTIIGIWSTLKHLKGQNIDLAEIIIVWCQIAFIIFVCYSATQIAKYISSNGYSLELIISKIT